MLRKRNFFHTGQAWWKELGRAPTMGFGVEDEQSRMGIPFRHPKFLSN